MSKTRDELVADYAAFWWAQETGETDDWEDLDADEREAVIENSCAETVVDWMTERASGAWDADGKRLRCRDCRKSISKCRCGR